MRNIDYAEYMEAVKRELRRQYLEQKQRREAKMDDGGWQPHTIVTEPPAYNPREIEQTMATNRSATALPGLPPQAPEALAQQLQNISIERSGNKLIIPPDMDLDVAMEAIRIQKAMGNKKVDVEYDFDLMVPEGALAFYRALDDLHGFTELMDTPTWFGPQPPKLLTIETSRSTTRHIPWGRFRAPGMEGHFQTEVKWRNAVPYFHLKASIPAGDRLKVQQIVEQMKANKETIYKGNAVRVKFPAMDEDPSLEDFFPRFMRLATITEDQLIFSADVANMVDATLFAPIKKAEFCREHGISLKRGVLLEGPPGVGKTLTASVTATLAQLHGWTFIQCENVRDLARVYQFAMHHQPAVISCEDLDIALRDAPERDDVINNILNSIDGIESKDLEIILVLTTNYVGRITQASLRPGRIDTVVPVRPPDAEAAQRLIRLYAGDGLLPTEDLTRAGELLDGKMAAVVREVVERSKLSAVRWLTQPGQALPITARDIEVAALGMEAHNRLLQPKEHDERSDIEKAAAILVAGLRAPANGTASASDEHVRTLVRDYLVKEGMPRVGAPVELQRFGV